MVQKQVLTSFDTTELTDYAKLSAPDTLLNIFANHAVEVVESLTGYALRELLITITNFYKKMPLPYIGFDENYNTTLKYDDQDVVFDDYYTVNGELLIPKLPEANVKIELTYKAVPIVDPNVFKPLVYKIATYMYDNRTTELTPELLAEIKKFRRWLL